MGNTTIHGLAYELFDSTAGIVNGAAELLEQVRVMRETEFPGFDRETIDASSYLTPEEAGQLREIYSIMRENDESNPINDQTGA
jgi:hypothetical protein